MCVLIHFCMGRRTDEYVLFYHQLRRGILLLLRMESLRSEYKHALAVALSEFDGGFDGIRWYVVITQQHDFYIIWCSLISQHEGILLYLIVKSIKATSMLEMIAVGTVCWYLLSSPPCSPRMSGVHVYYTLANLSRRRKYYQSHRVRANALRVEMGFT